MPNSNKTKEIFEPKLANRVQLLIIGRLLMLFLLLVSGWIWQSGTLRLSFDNLPQGLFLIFVIAVGLTIAYFFVLRLSKNLRLQVNIQLILDVFLISMLVWRTGDISSPYISLYFVTISISAFFLDGKGIIFLGGLSAGAFLIIVAASQLQLVQTHGQVIETAKLVQFTGFQVVGILVVGLLASRLSERNRSGEELRETAASLADLKLLHERIVESIRSGLMTTDLDGKIYSFNAAAAEITGLRVDEVIGKSASQFMGDISEEIKISLAAQKNGDQPPRFEADMQTPDGFVVRIGYGIAPLVANSGESTGLIITFQDLTEIRSMEESIRRKDRLAALGRVAAGLAHEIRNPLGAMRGAIQVMESQTEAGTPQASLMEIILRESDRLNSIITNFLTYARPRVSNFSEVDLYEAIDDTFTLLRHSPDVKDSHALTTSFPEDSLIISADPAQLKQIFWNLARNAIQAMPNGGSFSAAVEHLPLRRVRITFSDTGRGMPPEQVEQLFEPFSESTTGGTGLGLSIVYQIVRDHNGTISVRSLEGEGTSIIVELPTDTPLQQTGDQIEPRKKFEDYLNVRGN